MIYKLKGIAKTKKIAYQDFRNFNSLGRKAVWVCINLVLAENKKKQI